MKEHLCSICHTHPSRWTWQPFGPEESINCFTLPGWHYRGFPAIACCIECKARVGHLEDVAFTYKKLATSPVDTSAKSWRPLSSARRPVPAIYPPE